MRIVCIGLALLSAAGTVWSAEKRLRLPCQEALFFEEECLKFRKLGDKLVAVAPDLVSVWETLNAQLRQMEERVQKMVENRSDALSSAEVSGKLLLLSELVDEYCAAAQDQKQDLELEELICCSITGLLQRTGADWPDLRAELETVIEPLKRCAANGVYASAKACIADGGGLE